MLIEFKKFFLLSVETFLISLRLQKIIIQIHFIIRKAHDLIEVQLCDAQILLPWSGTSLFQVTTQQKEIPLFTFTIALLSPPFSSEPLLPQTNKEGTIKNKKFDYWLFSFLRTNSSQVIFKIILNICNYYL